MVFETAVVCHIGFVKIFEFSNCQYSLKSHFALLCQISCWNLAIIIYIVVVVDHLGIIGRIFGPCWTSGATRGRTGRSETIISGTIAASDAFPTCTQPTVSKCLENQSQTQLIHALATTGTALPMPAVAKAWISCVCDWFSKHFDTVGLVHVGKGIRCCNRSRDYHFKATGPTSSSSSKEARPTERTVRAWLQVCRVSGVPLATSTPPPTLISCSVRRATAAGGHWLTLLPATTWPGTVSTVVQARLERAARRVRRTSSTTPTVAHVNLASGHSTSTAVAVRPCCRRFCQVHHD